jgi:hypothetical protein
MESRVTTVLNVTIVAKVNKAGVVNRILMAVSVTITPKQPS